MTTVPALAILIALSSGAVCAQTPPLSLPTPATLAEHAAKRFPQPVRAGDLIGRDVLQPEESQPVIGRVQALTRRQDGGIDMIIHAGSTLGIGGRSVALPIEAVALLGEHVALIDYTLAQFEGLPTVQAGPSLPPDEVLKVGLVKPFH